jgi:hypothetical protein
MAKAELRYVAQGQASIEQQLELMETGKVRTGEDTGDGLG